MAHGIQVTFDCADPARLGRFWAEALGYVEQPPPGDFASWPEFLASQGIPESEWTAFNAVVDPDAKGPRLFFQRVPEPKVVKNRLHLDVNVRGGDVAQEVERLRAAGATHVRDWDKHGEHWVVMADPEGNEFCVQ